MGLPSPSVARIRNKKEEKGEDEAGEMRLSCGIVTEGSPGVDVDR